MTVWKQGRRTFALTLQVARLHDVKENVDTWERPGDWGWYAVLACLLDGHPNMIHHAVFIGLPDP